MGRSGTAVAVRVPMVLVKEAVRPRRDSIDLVRGLVMVIMVLDHVRDFVSGSAVHPRDVTDPALFLTRWITHYCAPVFMFLAGVSAYLYGHRGRTRAELGRFLLTRGLWLVALELTVVRVAWTFHFPPDVLALQVIWAIGVSMVVLSGLVFLPRWAIAAFALAVIGGHNLLDGWHAAQLGPWWTFVHERAFLHPWEGFTVFVSYPLIPWIGVMAAGFAFGPLFTRPDAERKRRLVQWGLGLVAVFVILRATGIYGDPAPRVAHADPLAAILSFIDCEKYPPSLLYLCMTLGPALLLLAAAEHARGRFAAWLVTFGRVPMLFYVAHLYLIHAVAVVYATAWGNAGWLFGGLPTRSKPPGYGVSLPVTYAIWIGVVLALAPLCRWFAALKQRRNDWWLSYL